MKKTVFWLFIIFTTFCFKVYANFEDDCKEILDIYKSVDSRISTSDLNTLKSEINSIKNISESWTIITFFKTFLSNQDDIDIDDFLQLINRIKTNQRSQSDSKEAAKRISIATEFEETYKANIYEINQFLDRILVVNDLKNIESSLLIIFNYQKNYTSKEILSIIDWLWKIAFNYQDSEDAFNIINHFIKNSKNIDSSKITSLIKDLTDFSQHHSEEFINTTISLICDFLSFNKETSIEEISNLLSLLKWTESKSEVRTLINNLDKISGETTISTNIWQTTINQLKDLWLTNDIINIILRWNWISSWNILSWTTKNEKESNTKEVKKAANWTTKKWREILKELKAEWWTEEQIKQEMEFLWINYSSYFPDTNSNNLNSKHEIIWNFIEEYQSRSCKIYYIIYNNDLWVYTSNELKNTEYFINTDYLKRYIDSKNPQQQWCPNINSRISSAYNDQNNLENKYIAPNWKVYFIYRDNNKFKSNELSNSHNFSSIEQLKDHIKEHNLFINMNS